MKAIFSLGLGVLLWSVFALASPAGAEKDRIAVSSRVASFIPSVPNVLQILAGRPHARFTYVGEMDANDFVGDGSDRPDILFAFRSEFPGQELAFEPARRVVWEFAIVGDDGQALDVVTKLTIHHENPSVSQFWRVLAQCIGQMGEGVEVDLRNGAPGFGGGRFGFFALDDFAVIATDDARVIRNAFGPLATARVAPWISLTDEDSREAHLSNCLAERDFAPPFQLRQPSEAAPTKLPNSLKRAWFEEGWQSLRKEDQLAFFVRDGAEAKKAFRDWFFEPLLYPAATDFNKTHNNNMRKTGLNGILYMSEGKLPVVYTAEQQYFDKAEKDFEEKINYISALDMFARENTNDFGWREKKLSEASIQISKNIIELYNDYLKYLIEFDARHIMTRELFEFHRISAIVSYLLHQHYYSRLRELAGSGAQEAVQRNQDASTYYFNHAVTSFERMLSDFCRARQPQLTPELEGYFYCDVVQYTRVDRAEDFVNRDFFRIRAEIKQPRDFGRLQPLWFLFLETRSPS